MSQLKAYFAVVGVGVGCSSLTEVQTSAVSEPVFIAAVIGNAPLQGNVHFWLKHSVMIFWCVCVCGGGAQQQLCLEEHPGNLFFQCHVMSFFIIIIIIIVVIQ